jgi:UDP-glucose 4-epimerase
MSTVLVTGGAGLVGRHIVETLLAHGYSVRIASRTPPPPGLFVNCVDYARYTLDPDDDVTSLFEGADHLVHAAFSHIPGRYRSGEGNNPAGFRTANLDATVRLFERARKVGIRRAVFLSSRAVYDGAPPATELVEDRPLAPTSFYGAIKLEAERAIAALSGKSFVTASLRLTGVYGDHRPNKWDTMIEAHLAGDAIPVRAGSEVHGRDVGQAVRLMLETDPELVVGRAFNVSDIVADTRDILSFFSVRGGNLPAAADKSAVAVMPTRQIEALGWKPGGYDLFAATLRSLARTSLRKE